jgi:cephalosporin-C deacetylase-like acetyl esterase
MLVVASLLTQSLVAGKYSFKLATNKPDAIYCKGEKITISALFLRDKKPAAGYVIKYKLTGDGGFRKDGKFTSGQTPGKVSLSVNYPAWIYAEFTAFGKDGKPLRTIERGKQVNLTGEIGVMVAPLDLTAASKEPADFDAFWKSRRAMLDKVPIKAALTKIKIPAKYKAVEVFEAKVSCAGESPVTGYLLKPVKAAPKSLPAIVIFNSASVRSARIPLKYAENKVIAFDVNPYGIANGKSKDYYNKLKKTSLRGYSHRNKNNRSKFYFHDMFLRVMRSLEFVKTLPEWDGKNLIIIGGSMGGGQGIAGSALDRDVSLAVIDVPALCDFAGVMAKPVRKSGWPRPYKVSRTGVAEKTDVANAVAYYDGVNFAKRIKCPIYVCTGFIDNVCPPSSVFVFYNNLPKDTEKCMTINPRTGHYGTTRNVKGIARLNRFFSLKK